MSDTDTYVVEVRIEGALFMARPDTVGTDRDELALLGDMLPNKDRIARIASLQQNVRDAYEMLLTATVLGNA